MIEYKCPYCGQRVNVFILTSYPPIIRYKCVSCSYEYETQGAIQSVNAPIPGKWRTYEESTNGC